MVGYRKANRFTNGHPKQKTHVQTSQKFCMCFPVSALVIRQQWNTLCTSGFVVGHILIHPAIWPQ